MKKFTVCIEETVTKEVEIIAENAESAMLMAERKYKRGEIVLEPGECQFRQMSIVQPETESIEWIEF